MGTQETYESPLPLPAGDALSIPYYCATKIETTPSLLIKRADGSDRLLLLAEKVSRKVVSERFDILIPITAMSNL